MKLEVMQREGTSESVEKTRMRQLFSEIGRHVSRNAFISEQCRSAAKGQIPMIDVMRALRKSVAMNHLQGFAVTPAAPAASCGSRRSRRC